MPTQRLNFKQIREQADFEKVLSAYGISLQKDGSKEGQFKGLCPFHDDHSPSMKVNTDKNIFHCFACEAGGNVLEFVMKIEQTDLRGAAKKIASLSNISTETSSKTAKSRKQELDGLKQKKDVDGRRKPRKGQQKQDRNSEMENGASDTENQKNPPLTFQLKNLKTEHPFLDERGFTPKMVATFGMGIATGGIMEGRLVFPIHNGEGRLVAYCGRYVEKKRPQGEPKYKHPAKFRKDLEWFNWHRAIERLSQDRDPLIVVESFMSTVKLHAEGYPVVSPMGRSLSQYQIDRLVESRIKSVCLLFDGDDPGRAAVTKVGRQLLKAGLTVSAPVVGEKFKPHRIDPKELALILSR